MKYFIQQIDVKTRFPMDITESSIGILLYVEDLLIFDNHIKGIQDLEVQLQSEFEMKDMGDIDVYLGISVIRRSIVESTIEMTQKGFIVNLVKKIVM